ncbi:MAG: bifunctional hydroxymethylpyrimidine kinase/phosphomethylpyrimidine kinase, partial [Burkholderiaceae bacterium]
MTEPSPPTPANAQDDSPCCVMSFNVSDPTGATGITADALAMASAAAYTLPVVTSVLLRDTIEVHDHHALDAELIAEQARRLLEDVSVNAFKVGFLGNTENVSAVAEILNDYNDVPVIAY